jgi:hypothetical protein
MQFIENSDTEYSLLTVMTFKCYSPFINNIKTCHGWSVNAVQILWVQREMCQIYLPLQYMQKPIVRKEARGETF